MRGRTHGSGGNIATAKFPSDEDEGTVKEA
jgi:hypothetical protein